MRSLSLLIAVAIFCPLVFADDKKSGNNLKVKINHKYQVAEKAKTTKPTKKTKPTNKIKEYQFQFRYDTEEWLVITDRPESSTGVYLRRGEVAKLKAIIEKMLKFGDAVIENQITGVKKEFKGEDVPKMIRADLTYADISENVKKPFDKLRIRYCIFDDNYSNSLYWNHDQLAELAKIFDGKQKEVFKKYDLLKALND